MEMLELLSKKLSCIIIIILLELKELLKEKRTMKAAASDSSRK